MRIAVIGGGISGIAAATFLDKHHDITVFEEGNRLGGHTNTVNVSLDKKSFDVDTGFIVHNRRNYPVFCSLLDEWGVATQPSEMSFSVSDQSSGLEFAGRGMRGLFAQRRNVLRPSFWRLLFGVVRFGRLGRKLLKTPEPFDPYALSVDDFLRQHHFSKNFEERYLLPLGSAIWSADPTAFSQFPARALMRFLDNHGLLSLRNRPEWRTIEGGSQRYVEAAIAKLRAQIRLGSAVESVQREVDGVLVTTKNGREEFDEVVFAVHSDQVLEILSDATLEEKDVLNAIAYQRNVAVLHTDHRMMPATKRAYASWNYFRSDKQATLTSVTYWMNCLQRLGASRDILVTLNREEEIDPSLVLGTYVYHHPVFDAAAFRAQTKWSSINGVRHTWFCGAYWGYGFHEDGAASALRVARALNGRSK